MQKPHQTDVQKRLAKVEPRLFLPWLLLCKLVCPYALVLSLLNDHIEHSEWSDILDLIGEVVVGIRGVSERSILECEKLGARGDVASKVEDYAFTYRRAEQQAADNEDQQCG